MIVHHMPQGSEEWFAKRRGIPTASDFDRIVTAAKLQPSKQRFGLIDELIAECFFDCPDSFTGTRWTVRGSELEPQARAEFAQLVQCEVDEVGFVTNDDATLGCSPDSLVATEDKELYAAGVELKCPAPATHIRYHRGSGLPGEYRLQVHGSMAVTGLPSWYFMSYCPGMAPFCVRVDRNEYTEEVASMLLDFVDEYRAEWSKLVPTLGIESEPNE